jgi:hypothetical protein
MSTTAEVRTNILLFLQTNDKTIRNLTLPRRWLIRMLFDGMWRRLFWWILKSSTLNREVVRSSETPVKWTWRHGITYRKTVIDITRFCILYHTNTSTVSTHTLFVINTTLSSHLLTGHPSDFFPSPFVRIFHLLYGWYMLRSSYPRSFDPLE